MDQPEIRIYVGKIKDWTKDLGDSMKKRETLCGRRLLAYGLLDLGWKDVFSEETCAEEACRVLEEKLERTVYGKPYFRDEPRVQFSISHTGSYAACAVSLVPCGLDIQEIRPIRSKRLLERTMSEEEQQAITTAENSEWEFCKYWSMKESFLKLTGEGITRSMKELEKPEWYETFVIQEHISGCISAGERCRVFCMEVPAEKFFKSFCPKS